MTTENTRLLAAIGVGVICGLWPLIKGLKNDQKKLGIWGMISCSVGGKILGVILALPIAWRYAYMIKKASLATVNPEDKNTEGYFSGKTKEGNVPIIKQTKECNFCA